MSYISLVFTLLWWRFTFIVVNRKMYFYVWRLKCYILCLASKVKRFMFNALWITRNGIIFSTCCLRLTFEISILESQVSIPRFLQNAKCFSVTLKLLSYCFFLLFSDHFFLLKSTCFTPPLQIFKIADSGNVARNLRSARFLEYKDGNSRRNLLEIFTHWLQCTYLGVPFRGVKRSYFATL